LEGKRVFFRRKKDRERKEKRVSPRLEMGEKKGFVLLSPVREKKKKLRKATCGKEKDDQPILKGGGGWSAEGGMRLLYREKVFLALGKIKAVT